LKEGRIATLNGKNGLPCDAVHWGMEDDVNSFWLKTACGLVRIDRSELDAWTAAVDRSAQRTIQVTVFDGPDGVRSTAIKHGFTPLVAKSADGKLWFPNEDGFSIVDPRHLSSNKLPPPVHIEQITADQNVYWQNSSGDASTNLHLPARVRDLQIDYTALSFVVPEKVHFRYKLEGWDNDWQWVGNRRQAFYTNLSPGDYRFRVAASNNSGVWNEAGAPFVFSIAPAYYQTTWFRLSCVAAFLAMLWALYQLRLRQATQRVRHRMEGRLVERERIARELHDTLLQSVQGLILKFDAVAKQIPRDEPARTAMDEALDRADEVMGEGRERVRSLRAGASALNDLPAAFQRVADETAPGREATFKTIVEGSVRELNPMILEESYSIGREALINALAHSGGLHVEVEIMYDPRKFRLRVRDDGRGVDPGILEKGGRPGHWGMQGMRERAQGMGAQLGLWSRPGSGTEVELSVPAATAYRSGRTPAKISWLGRGSGNGR
jgi:signal transduction histidine kinase